MISTASGKNDASSILKISSRCQFISQVISARTATPTPNTIQYHIGAGTRSAAAAGGSRGCALAATGGGAVASAAGFGDGCSLAASAGGSLRPAASFGGSCNPPLFFGGSCNPPSFGGLSSSDADTRRPPGPVRSCRRRPRAPWRPCTSTPASAAMESAGQQRHEQLARHGALWQRRLAQSGPTSRRRHCVPRGERLGTAAAAAPCARSAASGGARCGFHLASTIT